MFVGQSKAARAEFWRVQDVPRQRVTICMLEHLSIILDPRLRKVKHLMTNILFFGMVASLCGAEDFVSMAEFGKARKDWFAKFLDLSNGIPSHDRFNAVFSLLKLEIGEVSLMENGCNLCLPPPPDFEPAQSK